MELFFLITGGILLGEAIALFIGVYLIKKGNVEWNTKMNNIYLIIDFLSGILIALNYCLFENTFFNILVTVCVVISIVTHFRRTSDYLLKKDQLFCINKALFFMNNFKMIILFGSLFLVLPF